MHQKKIKEQKKTVVPPSSTDNQRLVASSKCPRLLNLLCTQDASGCCNRQILLVNTASPRVSLSTLRMACQPNLPLERTAASWMLSSKGRCNAMLQSETPQNCCKPVEGAEAYNSRHKHQRQTFASQQNQAKPLSWDRPPKQVKGNPHQLSQSNTSNETQPQNANCFPSHQVPPALL